MTNETTCPECYGTGFWRGMGGPCSRECLPLAGRPRTIVDRSLNLIDPNETDSIIRDRGFSVCIIDDPDPWTAHDACEIVGADDDDEAIAIAALANCLTLTREQLEGITVDGIGIHALGFAITADGAEYSVLTDGEADRAWDEALESYLDDCLLSDLPDLQRRYFDGEAWKRDARHDGRGHSLSGYDGDELEGTADGRRLYIYRTN